MILARWLSFTNIFHRKVKVLYAFWEDLRGLTKNVKNPFVRIQTDVVCAPVYFRHFWSQKMVINFNFSLFCFSYKCHGYWNRELYHSFNAFWNNQKTKWLVKLKLTVNFIKNYVRNNFCTKVLFCPNITREKLREELSYKKCMRKVLVKLKPEFQSTISSFRGRACSSTARRRRPRLRRRTRPSCHRRGRPNTELGCVRPCIFVFICLMMIYRKT